MLLGLPLLAVAVAALGGITHLRSCTAAPSPPFAISNVPAPAKPIVSSALVVERSAEPPASCAGIDLLLQVQPRSPGRVRVLLPVSNTSTKAVHASVRVQLKGSSYPVLVGRVRPGKTVVRSLDIRVPKGDSELLAQLLVGP